MSLYNHVYLYDDFLKILSDSSKSLLKEKELNDRMLLYPDLLRIIAHYLSSFYRLKFP